MQSQSAISAVIKHQSAADQLLNPAAAAEFLGVSVDTLSVWRSVGRYSIPYLKVGRLVKYRRADLEMWLQSRTHGEVV
jgi:excisionase family DNA binding protein